MLDSVLLSTATNGGRSYQPGPVSDTYGAFSSWILNFLSTLISKHLVDLRADSGWPLFLMDARLCYDGTLFSLKEYVSFSGFTSISANGHPSN